VKFVIKSFIIYCDVTLGGPSQGSRVRLPESEFGPSFFPNLGRERLLEARLYSPPLRKNLFVSDKIRFKRGRDGKRGRDLIRWLKNLRKEYRMQGNGRVEAPTERNTPG